MIIQYLYVRQKFTVPWSCLMQLNQLISVFTKFLSHSLQKCLRERTIDFSGWLMSFWAMQQWVRLSASSPAALFLLVQFFVAFSSLLQRSSFLFIKDQRSWQALQRRLKSSYIVCCQISEFLGPTVHMGMKNKFESFVMCWFIVLCLLFEILHIPICDKFSNALFLAGCDSSIWILSPTLTESTDTGVWKSEFL